MVRALRGRARAIRERRHDVYLIDYRLGERTGLDLVREGLGANPHAPVLMLTGQGNYEIDLAASALGITDYLIKQELTPASLERSIRYAIGHHQAMRDLAFVEERYALAARAASDGIWDWDLARGEIYFSSRWHAILGLPESIDHETPAAWFALVHADDVPRLQAAIDAHLAGQSPHLAGAPDAPRRRQLAVGADPRTGHPRRREPPDADGRLAV